MVNFKSGNLEFWAKQGVLLLNNTLTVRQSATQLTSKNLERIYQKNITRTFGCKKRCNIFTG